MCVCVCVCGQEVLRVCEWRKLSAWEQLFFVDFFFSKTLFIFLRCVFSFCFEEGCFLNDAKDSVYHYLKILPKFSRADLDIQMLYAEIFVVLISYFKWLLNTPSQWFSCMSCTSRSALDFNFTLPRLIEILDQISFKKIEFYFGLL